MTTKYYLAEVNGKVRRFKQVEAPGGRIYAIEDGGAPVPANCVGNPPGHLAGVSDQNPPVGRKRKKRIMLLRRRKPNVQ